mgnify:CR=1 FL=1
MDAEFKIDLINDILASKEMYLGRYYFDRKKWIPAINRFKKVADEYDTTIYVEEALHRLVEVHYIIGLNKEAKKYAQILGYNYKSSKWYEKSYAMFDKTYAANKKLLTSKNKKSNIVIRKFKSLLESAQPKKQKFFSSILFFKRLSLSASMNLSPNGVSYMSTLTSL